MALDLDVDGLVVDAAAIRQLGIEPRPVTGAIASMRGTRTPSA
jgi:hypothetical protein